MNIPLTNTTEEEKFVAGCRNLVRQCNDMYAEHGGEENYRKYAEKRDREYEEKKTNKDLALELCHRCQKFCYDRFRGYYYLQCRDEHAPHGDKDSVDCSFFTPRYNLRMWKTRLQYCSEMDCRFWQGMRGGCSRGTVPSLKSDIDESDIESGKIELCVACLSCGTCR